MPHFQSLNSNSTTTTTMDTNQQLVEQFDLMLPNRDLHLVVRPLGRRETISVYFDTRLSLYEFGILPGMIVTLVNLNRKQTERSICYKTSNHLKAVFNQRFGGLFFDLPSSLFSSSTTNEQQQIATTDANTNTNLTRKKISLHERLVQMDNIYDCFYKTDSNLKKYVSLFLVLE